jgi:hypothetical protein
MKWGLNVGGIIIDMQAESKMAGEFAIICESI